MLFLAAEVKDQGRRGNVVVGLALEAKATFPSVRRDVLLRNLCKRGLPEEIIAWVSSFLEDRTCYFVLEGCRSERLDRRCGLPQGLPLSPILYLFYNAHLFDALPTPSCSSLGYINNLFVLSWGKDAKTALRKVQDLLPQVESWCTDHGTVMEANQLELIVLTHKKIVGDLPPLLLNGIAIPRVPTVTGRLWVKVPTLEPQQRQDQCVCLDSEVLVS